MTRGAALAVPVLALAACGGSATSNSLEDAAKETAESSSRIEMQYEANDGSFRGSFSGAFDYGEERAIVTDFEFHAGEAQWAGDPQPTEVRVVDGVDYLAYEIEGKTYWVREAREGAGDPYALLFPFPGAAYDASDVFSMVLRASDKIENLGPEQMRGDEATHYRASVDLRKLADEVPPAQRDEFLDGMAREAILPVELWVDRESRLRRVRIEEQLVGEVAGGQDAGILMTFELYDHGVDVEVEAPPADQVITQERFEELTSPSDEELEVLCREEAPKGEADEYCEETGEGE